MMAGAAPNVGTPHPLAFRVPRECRVAWDSWVPWEKR